MCFFQFRFFIITSCALHANYQSAGNKNSPHLFGLSRNSCICIDVYIFPGSYKLGAKMPVSYDMRTKKNQYSLYNKNRGEASELLNFYIQTVCGHCGAKVLLEN